MAKVQLIEYASLGAIPRDLRPVGYLNKATSPGHAKKHAVTWVTRDTAVRGQAVYGAVKYAEMALIPRGLTVIGGDGI